MSASNFVRRCNSGVLGRPNAVKLFMQCGRLPRKCVDLEKPSQAFYFKLIQQPHFFASAIASYTVNKILNTAISSTDSHQPHITLSTVSMSSLPRSSSGSSSGAQLPTIKPDDPFVKVVKALSVYVISILDLSIC